MAGVPAVGPVYRTLPGSFCLTFIAIGFTITPANGSIYSRTGRICHFRFVYTVILLQLMQSKESRILKHISSLE